MRACRSTSSPGDEVAGATLNTSGRLVVEVTRIGRDTAVARIADLVRHAQATKAPVQRLADRVSAVFVPVVLAVAVLTFAVWALLGDPTGGFIAAVAVLVIACPCALGLATPTALLVGTGRAAQLGVVIRDAAVLEQTRRIDTVVLDKTGTVTTGRMAVHEVVTHHAEAVRLAGALEASSEHPLGRAVAEYVARTGPQPWQSATPAGHRLREPRRLRRLRGGGRSPRRGRPGPLHRHAADGRRAGAPAALRARRRRSLTAREAGRTAVLVEIDDGLRPSSTSATASRTRARTPYDGCEASACTRCCSPATTPPRRAPWPPRSASTRWSPR